METIQTPVNVACHASSEVKHELNGLKVYCRRRGVKPAFYNTCILEDASRSNVLEKSSAIVVAESNDKIDAGLAEIVPFEDEVAGKKKWIPKVILDGRTVREYEASIGKKSSDENERKSWAEERKNIHEMVTLFIRDVEKIQGEMKLSNWKGSVLDSVMVAYLTQNVSDPFSSSVFMGLMNKYPPRDTMADRVKLKKRSCTMKNEPVDTRCPVIKRRKSKGKDEAIDWCRLKKKYFKREPIDKQSDSLDWEAIRIAKLDDVADVIKERGQQRNIASRMQNCLNLLKKELGSTDLEWMRRVPTNEAREHLLSMLGLGPKSVECILLLGLKQEAFPIDTHAGRVFVRLGWVPTNEPPKGREELHKEEYPEANDVQMYLWPRLCQLSLPVLYELHCQVITLGKVFCTKTNPNCKSCPMKAECRYYKNKSLGARGVILGNPKTLGESSGVDTLNSQDVSECDIEDFGSREIVPLSASKRKSVSVANTKKHEVYVLPHSHPFLRALPKIEREDRKNPQCKYLLATFTKDEAACTSEEDVFDGTILIPIRRAVKTFPFNGTHFQENEVCADYESSENPIQVSRLSLESLKQRATLHCGKNVAPICKGMETQEVKEFFHEGYICSRSIDIKTMGTKPLHPRFGNPARKNKAKKSRSKKMKLELE